MKKTLTATALILATAGSAAFAQGMEGHQIGYNDKSDNGVSYSSRSDAVDAQTIATFTKGTLRAEDTSDVTVTVFPTAQSDESVDRFPR
ncbi:tryptophan synthase subunit beta [Sulfitobacter sp. S0837]|uniref:tryptophan synthase subunit beta n=1 Tax=Sulfitobacter maritimus TaxID=2741719 RepID=UPI0015834311|nr:tryptophan synthase subunit beta [Sulfitobacter maritimus]NUH65064.1 tryptophan synthase subunit beta [Sulfitobacter maritimus]